MATAKHYSQHINWLLITRATQILNSNAALYALSNYTVAAYQILLKRVKSVDNQICPLLHHRC
ncbi:hypothetical protein CRENPOLYSF1_50007 [Crenothrix polyspora]|uniref:Uncharacterized protein n=1 Tax=Crenothrix polyspora TaxID=360316 RepID=A0A1R4HCX7_9GAMM|nr:hypothetical protein CRENPOLYSF1_50007 [Crenothrix polyspora]